MNFLYRDIEKQVDVLGNTLISLRFGKNFIFFANIRKWKSIPIKPS